MRLEWVAIIIRSVDVWELSGDRSGSARQLYHCGRILPNDTGLDNFFGSFMCESQTQFCLVSNILQFTKKKRYKELANDGVVSL